MERRSHLLYGGCWTMPTPRRVLVVDDDDGVRCVLALILTSNGYEVRTARDGMDALEKLACWPAQLIILDLMMPVMDGWGFRRGQTANAQLTDIPVVVLSAVRDLQRGGPHPTVAALLAKPFDLTELLALVRRLIGSTAL